MGTIVISENVSLDGVVQDPAGDEGFGRGGWVGPIAAREDVARLASTRRWERMPSCWVGEATSGWLRAGRHGAASWRTG
jgi:hypothetical protein